MGYLFLIVGPSGSGKDALIDYIVKRFPLIKKVRRVITRENNEYEDFDSINIEDFSDDDFFISWKVYDKKYGIRKEVLRNLIKGDNYLINVSREVINEVRTKWSNTVVIELTAPKDVLYERIKNRHRESSSEVKKRTQRRVKIKNDFIIDTKDSDVGIAGNKLLNYIKKTIL